MNLTPGQRAWKIAYEKKRKLENPEYYRQARRRWYDRHKAEQNAKTAEWYARNSVKHRTLSDRWKKEHPDKVKLYKRRRYTSGLALDESLRRRAKKAANGVVNCFRKIRLLKMLPLCHYCFLPFSDRRARTIDHVIPIDRGGAHVPHNLVAACGICNSSKGAKLLSEWRGSPHVLSAS